MGHLSSPPHKAAMIYLGYPSSAPQQLLKLSWWVQHPGCRTRQRTRLPGFLFRKLGAGRGRSKQLRPGFLPWRMRAGRFCEPCPEQGRAPTLAGHEGTECPPHWRSPGVEPSAPDQQRWKGSCTLKTELEELRLVPAALLSLPFKRCETDRAPGRGTCGAVQKEERKHNTWSNVFANPRQSTTRQREARSTAVVAQEAWSPGFLAKSRLIFSVGTPGNSPSRGPHVAPPRHCVRPPRTERM